MRLREEGSSPWLVVLAESIVSACHLGSVNQCRRRRRIASAIPTSASDVTIESAYRSRREDPVRHAYALPPPLPLEPAVLQEVWDDPPVSGAALFDPQGE
jgi:hypothetical protein